MARQNHTSWLLVLLLTLLPGFAPGAGLFNPLAAAGAVNSYEADVVGVTQAKAGANINKTPLNRLVGFPVSKWVTTWTPEEGVVETITPLLPQGAWIECFNDSVQSVFGPQDNQMRFTGQRPVGFVLPANLTTLRNMGSITLHANQPGLGFVLESQAAVEGFCYHVGFNPLTQLPPSGPPVTLIQKSPTAPVVDVSALLDPLYPVIRGSETYTLNVRPGVVCVETNDGLFVRASNWRKGPSRVRITGDRVEVDGPSNTTVIKAPIACGYSGRSFEIVFGPNLKVVIDNLTVTGSDEGPGVTRLYHTHQVAGDTGFSIPVQNVPRTTASSGPVTGGYYANGFARQLVGNRTGVEFVDKLPLTGTVVFRNSGIGNACMQVLVNPQFGTSIAAGPNPATCTAKGNWSFSINGVDFSNTDGLNTVDPFRLDNGEWVLNRTPEKRCSAAERSQFNSWQIVTLFEGKCVAVQARGNSIGQVPFTAEGVDLITIP